MCSSTSKIAGDSCSESTRPNSDPRAGGWREEISTYQAKWVNGTLGCFSASRSRSGFSHPVCRAVAVAAPRFNPKWLATCASEPQTRRRFLPISTYHCMQDFPRRARVSGQVSATPGVFISSRISAEIQLSVSTARSRPHTEKQRIIRAIIKLCRQSQDIQMAPGYRNCQCASFCSNSR